jgi:hypothetical protein
VVNPKREPMKQRFKRHHPYKFAREIVFDDDSTDYGSVAEIRRHIKYPAHGHAGGRKPQWRARLKVLRLYKREVTRMFGIFADIVKETVKTVKTVDRAVTDVYKGAKESAEELGVGPRSIREAIKDTADAFK